MVLLGREISSCTTGLHPLGGRGGTYTKQIPWEEGLAKGTCPKSRGTQEQLKMEQGGPAAAAMPTVAQTASGVRSATLAREDHASSMKMTMRRPRSSPTVMVGRWATPRRGQVGTVGPRPAKAPDSWPAESAKTGRAGGISENNKMIRDSRAVGSGAEETRGDLGSSGINAEGSAGEHSGHSPATKTADTVPPPKQRIQFRNQNSGYSPPTETAGQSCNQTSGCSPATKNSGYSPATKTLDTAPQPK